MYCDEQDSVVVTYNIAMLIISIYTSIEEELAALHCVSMAGEVWYMGTSTVHSFFSKKMFACLIFYLLHVIDKNILAVKISYDVTCT